MDKIVPGEVVSVHFHTAQFTLCKSALVLRVPQATGDSWAFRDLDSGVLHFVSEGCTVTKTFEGSY